MRWTTHQQTSLSSSLPPPCSSLSLSLSLSDALYRISLFLPLSLSLPLFTSFFLLSLFPRSLYRGLSLSSGALFLLSSFFFFFYSTSQSIFLVYPSFLLLELSVFRPFFSFYFLSRSRSARARCSRLSESMFHFTEFYARR